MLSKFRSIDVIGNGVRRQIDQVKGFLYVFRRNSAFPHEKNEMDSACNTRKTTFFIRFDVYVHTSPAD